MADFIPITDVGKALRVHRDKHGTEATEELMRKIAGVSDIRKVPQDDAIRQALIDAANPGQEEPQAPAAERNKRAMYNRNASPFSDDGAKRIFERFNRPGRRAAT